MALYASPLQPEMIFDKSYRARLFQLADVPVMKNLQNYVECGDQIVVVDLANPEGYEMELLNLEADRQAAIDRANSIATATGGGCDKENLPEGCVLVGDPLRVSFLTIEKLEQEFSSMKRFDTFEIDEPPPSDRLILEAHLFKSLYANTLSNRLAMDCGELLGRDLSQHPLVLFSEADKQGGRQLINGMYKSSDANISYKGYYCGLLSQAKSRLEKLIALRPYSLAAVSCQCSFDLLNNKLSLKSQSNGHFEPAEFVVRAEWSIPLINVKGVMTAPKVPFLEHPPGSATATLSFKPGIMDSRVLYTDRIFELKYLMALSDALKAHQIPWKAEATAAEDSSFIVKRVEQLVRSVHGLQSEDAENCRPQNSNLDSFSSGLDFVDSMWEILKTSSSVETLRLCFQLICSRLLEGTLNAHVGKRKTSWMAKMLRVRNPDDIYIPQFEPMACLHLLVEIGLDRFQGRLVQSFMKDKFLSSPTDLDPSFLKVSAPIDRRINRLLPLHMALQAMSMIEKALKMVPHERISMARRILAHFTEERCDEKGLHARQFVYTTTIENIAFTSIRNTVSEWVLVKSYNIPVTPHLNSSMFLTSNTQPKQPIPTVGGAHHDVVHIVSSGGPGLGLRYVRPFDAVNQNKPAEIKPIKTEANSESNIADEDLTLTKLTLAAGLGDQKKQSPVLEDIKPDPNLFECVYLEMRKHLNALMPN